MTAQTGFSMCQRAKRPGCQEAFLAHYVNRQGKRLPNRAPEPRSGDKRPQAVLYLQAPRVPSNRFSSFFEVWKTAPAWRKYCFDTCIIGGLPTGVFVKCQEKDRTIMAEWIQDTNILILNVDMHTEQSFVQTLECLIVWDCIDAGAPERQHAEGALAGPPVNLKEKD